MTPLRKAGGGSDAPPGGNVPGRPDLPTLRRKTNRNAIVAFVTGLVGLSVIALGFGISALAQIRARRLERGRTLAWIGLVTGGAWLVATVIAVSHVLPDDAAGNLLGDNRPGTQMGEAMGHRFPKPGECFDVSADGTQRKRSCTEPHDAEMVLIYELPDRDWPGQQEIDRLASADCDKRLLDRYQTRAPMEDGETMYFSPKQDIWAVGDRRVA
ncbi:septum formation family protein, partial [Actinomadura adrarensis]